MRNCHRTHRYSTREGSAYRDGQLSLGEEGHETPRSHPDEEHDEAQGGGWHVDLGRGDFALAPTHPLASKVAVDERW